MRTIFVAILIAIGLGLIGISQIIAAPAEGTAIAKAANNVLLNDAGYVRRHGRTCYHKCYRDFLIGPRVCRTYC